MPASGQPDIFAAKVGKRFTISHTDRFHLAHDDRVVATRTRIDHSALNAGERVVKDWNTVYTDLMSDITEPIRLPAGEASRVAFLILAQNVHHKAPAGLQVIVNRCSPVDAYEYQRGFQ